MKKIFRLFLLLIMPFMHASEEVITPDLLTLLHHFHLEHDGSIKSIKEVTQKAWLRPKGKERWETIDRYNSVDRAAVLEYYEKTGKLEERRPTKPVYQTALICGATTISMQKRVNFFEKLIHEGLCIEKVVLLSGARPLDSAVDEILPGCQTEGDALEKLWKMTSIYFNLPWVSMEQPLVGERRPTAYDIFKFWSEGGTPGRVLIVTNQPYCCFFESVAQVAMPDGVEFEVVGPAATPDALKTDVLLDNLARWIYNAFILSSL